MRCSLSLDTSVPPPLDAYYRHVTHAADAYVTRRSRHPGLVAKSEQSIDFAHIPTRFGQGRDEPCPKFEVPSSVQKSPLWGYRVSDANNQTRQITINSFSQRLLKDRNETANEYCLLYACGRTRLCLRVSFYFTSLTRCCCCW